jgi:hypothetical protein
VHNLIGDFLALDFGLNHGMEVLPVAVAVLSRLKSGCQCIDEGAEIAGVGNCVAAVDSGRATRDSSLDAPQSQAGKPD